LVRELVVTSVVELVRPLGGLELFQHLPSL